MMTGGEKKRPVGLLYLWLVLILAAVCVVSLCCGHYAIDPWKCIRILVSAPFGGTGDWSALDRSVLIGLRLPRILGAVLVGACLSVSGGAYQSVFQNPLVSPDILGVSSGACVGAAAAILLHQQNLMVMLFAFAAGVLTVAATLAIPRLLRSESNIMLVLSGIIVGSAMSSILGFLKYAADPDSELAAITYWTMGNFGYVQADKLLPLVCVTLPPLVILLLMSWWIDVLSMGEAEARALGANVRLIRGLAILCSTLLTAGSDCIAGTISWVGLIVPHFARLLVGPASRRLQPTSILLGGLFMLLVDTLTRIIGEAEMPVSIMTGLIGAPVFCWLLWRQREAAQ